MRILSLHTIYVTMSDSNRAKMRPGRNFAKEIRRKRMHLLFLPSICKYMPGNFTANMLIKYSFGKKNGPKRLRFILLRLKSVRRSVKAVMQFRRKDAGLL